MTIQIEPCAVLEQGSCGLSVWSSHAVLRLSSAAGPIRPAVNLYARKGCPEPYSCIDWLHVLTAFEAVFCLCVLCSVSHRSTIFGMRPLALL